MQHVNPSRELIPYDQFSKLRLKQFVPSHTVDESDGFEWMGGIWISEGIGFTSMYRPADTPEQTGGLEVDFSELPESASVALLDAIHLRLRPGMSFEAVSSVLGKPHKTESFVEDQKSYDFVVGSRDAYYISATVHERDGLIHIAIIRKDVLSKIDA